MWKPPIVGVALKRCGPKDEPGAWKSCTPEFGGGRLETCPVSGNALAVYPTKTDDALTPKARGPTARPSMVKADCLNPSHGGNRAAQ